MSESRCGRSVFARYVKVDAAFVQYRFSLFGVGRFYDPDGGRILLGGRDLSTYKPADISNVVSWVTQEPQLFPISGT